MTPILPPDHDTCRSFYRYKVGQAPRGFLVSLLNNESDITPLPLPTDLNSQFHAEPAVFYGPVTLNEHTTMMTLYNSTYRRDDLLISLDAFDATIWLLIGLTLTFLALLSYSFEKDFVSCVCSALRIATRVPLADDFMKALNTKWFRFYFAFLSLCILYLIIIFGNLIRASTIVKTKTTVFDDVQELLRSREYAPIWIKKLINARLFDQNSPLALEVKKAARRFNLFEENSWSQQKTETKRKPKRKKLVTYDLESYAKIFEQLAGKKRVFIGIGRVVKILEQLYRKTARHKQFIHLAKRKADATILTYGYSKGIDARARRTLDIS